MRAPARDRDDCEHHRAHYEECYTNESWYAGSSISRAASVVCSGKYVSHITASSSVRVLPIDFSYAPGCGPCGMPIGWCEIEPGATPRRDVKLPSQ